MSKLGTVKEPFGFLRREKKWWLIPMVMVLILFAFLIYRIVLQEFEPGWVIGATYLVCGGFAWRDSTC